MSVAPGETCVFSLNAQGDGLGADSGYNRNSYITILDNKIVERPKHGQAGLHGKLSLGYNADAKYRGQDHFMVERVVESGGQKQTQRISVTVEVQ